MSRWDRPKPPHDWRWWIGGLGRVLIATGLLTFGFVAYQLWGTGIETARSQRALETQFEELLAATPPPATAAPSTTTPADQAATTPQPAVIPVADQNLPQFEEGDAIARLEIPAIGLDNIVVAGVSTADLKKGPGHYPDTPLPGQLGNTAIAGHRTTYGAPFFDVDDLVVDDEIIVTTPTGRFVYKVTGTQIVEPSDYQVIATTDPTVATITLTSCDPKWSAAKRIIISGVLETEASAPVGEAVINYGRPMRAAADAGATTPATLPTESSTDGLADDGSDTTPVNDELSAAAQPGSAAANAGIADAFAEGWFSDSGAFSQVALWGLVLAAIGVLTYLSSRRFRSYPIGLTIGIVPFIVVLYFFFQNVNRLLPPVL